MATEISEMLRFARLVILIYSLYSCSESATTTLFPLGVVSVCPEGQLLLTCERINGSESVLFWDVSVPHMAGTTQRIVQSQGVLLSPEFKIGFTEFNISRTSSSPLISQLLINNVTAEINGSTFYCSEDGDENGAPAVEVIVVFQDQPLKNTHHSLNVTLVNHFLRNSVIVTLQWPREAGAVYHVSVSPEASHTEHTTTMHDILKINLTISYNVQYNVSVASSLCGVTTTKVLKYVMCDHPPTQLLQHDPVVMVTESDAPKVEGQFITYTCPSGFILIGPRVSVCTGNGEWEPDPGQVDCIGVCGLPVVNKYVKLNYSSILEGSVLMLTCKNEISNINTNTTDEQILNVTCHSDGDWSPNPADFIESCSIVTTVTVTVSPDAEILLWTPVLISLIVIAVCAVISIVFLSIGYACGWFSHKHKQSNAMSDSSAEVDNSCHNEESQHPQIPVPVYEELQSDNQDLVELKENVAYGPIVK